MNTKEVAKILQKEYISFLKKRISAFEYFLPQYLRTEIKKCLIVSKKWRTVNIKLDSQFMHVNHMLKICVPPIDCIYKDIMYLKKIFKRVYYKDKNLIVTTDPIIIDEINFGEFDIYMSKLYMNKDLQVGSYVRAVALQPNTVNFNEAYPHPHVEYEHICLGDSENALKLALLEFRIIDYFQIIYNILKTYNSESPFVKIEEWQDASRCFDCNELYTCDYLMTCDCFNELCEDCVIQCGWCATKHIMCGDCKTKCNLCNDYYCGECTINCNICNNTVCTTCSCDMCCPNLVCDECYHKANSCVKCEDKYCKDHIIECIKCGKYLCEGCVEKCSHC